MTTSLLWQYAGMLEPEVIPASSLESFGHDPADLDGDALEDALGGHRQARAPASAPWAVSAIPTAMASAITGSCCMASTPSRPTTIRPQAAAHDGVDDGAQLALDSWRPICAAVIPAPMLNRPAPSTSRTAGCRAVCLCLPQRRPARRLSARVRYHAAEDSQAEAGLLLRTGRLPDAATVSHSPLMAGCSAPPCRPATQASPNGPTIRACAAMRLPTWDG